MVIVACPLMDLSKWKFTNRDYQGRLKIYKCALEMYFYCNPDTPTDRLREIVPDIETPKPGIWNCKSHFLFSWWSIHANDNLMLHATLPRNIERFKMQRRRRKVGIAKVFKGNLNWSNVLWRQEIFLVWWWQSFFADWLCGSRSRPNHKSAVDSRLEPAEKILIVKKTLGRKNFSFSCPSKSSWALDFCSCHID